MGEPEILQQYGQRPSEALRFFEDAYKFTLDRHSTYYGYIADTHKAGSAAITPERFFADYVWTVFISGFRAQIVHAKFPAIRRALHGFKVETITRPYACETMGMKVIANKRKWESITRCILLLKELPWDKFQKKYLSSPEAMESLPHIGKIVKYHLARNLGFDVVKPDLHLVRVAEYFGYGSPTDLCLAFQQKAPSAKGVLLGQIDYCIWCYLSHGGKKQQCCSVEEELEVTLR